MTPSNANPDTPAKPKRDFRWPVIVVAMLGCHATAILFAVSIALGAHRSVGITPDYYAKAINWDATKAELRRSAELGWTVNVTPSIWLDQDGLREVVFHLTDAQGQPITDAQVELKGYHVVFTKNKVEGRATSHTDANGRAIAGAWATRLPMEQSGLWRLTIRVESKQLGEVFVTEIEQPIANVTMTAEPATNAATTP